MGNIVPEGYVGGTDKKKAARARFENVFTVIRKELLDHFKAEGLPADAAHWYERVSTTLKRIMSSSQRFSFVSLNITDHCFYRT